MILLSRLSGWPLSEIERLEQAEMLDWLAEAAEVEKQLGPRM